MPLVAWPAALEPRSVNWSQERPQVRQRSEFTGRSRVVEWGPTSRWTAEVEFPPLGPEGFRALTAFLAELQIAGNTTQLAIVEAPQAPTNWGSIFTTAPAAGATSGTFTGVPSTLYAPAGGFASLALPGEGTTQTVTLISPAQTNGSGVGTATWAQPLRAAASPFFDMFVPVALMRPASTNALSWRVEPGPIYLATLSLEEAF